jgi:DNA topoisomerase-2
MHLFHPVKGIHKYESPEEILIDFVKIRAETYKKRKAHLIRVLKEKAKKLENMSKFIDMVIHEKLIVFKRKRVELEREMEKIFDKIDGSYEYLLNIKTYQYTLEAIQSIREETSKSRIELDALQQMSHIDMWKRDLKIYKQ